MHSPRIDELIIPPAGLDNAVAPPTSPAVIDMLVVLAHQWGATTVTIGPGSASAGGVLGGRRRLARVGGVLDGLAGPFEFNKIWRIRDDAFIFEGIPT